MRRFACLAARLRGSFSRFRETRRSVLVRTPVESLETRTLLADIFHAKVNFQPLDANPVGAYVIDSGEAYDDRSNGFGYGWKNGQTGAAAKNTTAVDRDLYGNKTSGLDQLIDTLIMMPTTANTWEIAVPNGEYSVRLLATDADAAQHPLTMNIAVEGITAINGTTSASQTAFDVTVTRTVSDGKLTISNPQNLSGSRLNFVVIDSTATPTTAPAAPTDVQVRPASMTGADVIWRDNASDEDGHKIQRSPDGVNNWVTITTPMTSANVQFFANTSGLSGGNTYHSEDWEVIEITGYSEEPGYTVTGVLLAAKGRPEATVRVGFNQYTSLLENEEIGIVSIKDVNAADVSKRLLSDPRMTDRQRTELKFRQYGWIDVKSTGEFGNLFPPVRDLKELRARYDEVYETMRSLAAGPTTNATE